MINTSTKCATIIAAGLGALLIAGCASSNSSKMKASSVPFGTANGKAVSLYTLHNSKGAEAKIMTYGGIVQSLTMPDRNGKMDDIVLGYDNLAGYLKETPYFGALIGRYGNRIGKAKFTLDGKTYSLATNNGPNSLHGGLKGFDKVVWNVVKATGNALELQY